jgi:hypothetical protein
MMTTLSEALCAAAVKADQRAAEAIADGDPESAEVALASARQMRRLAFNRAAAAAYQGKPELDPELIVRVDDETECDVAPGNTI